MLTAVDVAGDGHQNCSSDEAASLGRALCRAARTGSLGDVTALLHQGADVEARNDAGVPVLCSAAMGGHVAVVRQLLRSGADANARDRHGFPVLMSVVEFPRPEVVFELLKAGADVNAVAPDGRTPLLNAVWSADSSAEVVALLVAAGADTTVRDANEGLTPQQWAERSGRTDLVDHL